MRQLPRAVRLPWTFDGLALCAEIECLGPEAWVPHFNTSYYEGDWSGVALRTPGGKIMLYPDPNPSEPYRDTALLDRAPRVKAALAQMGERVLSARVLRLGPGARVREHRDYQIGVDFGEVRVHVPLQTDALAEFVLDGSPLDMAAGECWYVDVTRPHRVANAGEEPRLHLVVDCRLDEELRTFLERGAGFSPLEQFMSYLERDAPAADALLAETDHARFTERSLALAATRGIALEAGAIEAATSAGRRRWFERNV